MKETKESRFRRVAAARVNKMIKMLQLLGNCSNRSTYSYTQEEVDKIFTTLRSEVDLAEKRFNEAQESGRPKFTLGEDETAE